MLAVKGEVFATLFYSMYSQEIYLLLCPSHYRFFFKEDGDVFDDYDHQMMLHGLGLQNATTCDSLVAFHKRFKHTLGGKHLLN